MKVISTKKNLPVVLSYIRKASHLHSDVICFPECSFNADVRKPSLEEDLLPIQKESKKGNISVVVNGYFREKDGNIYNRTYFIDNQGKILGCYDKIHPWANEIDKVKRGKTVKVINTPLGKIGFCTCWDLFFPDLFKKLKHKGAEIIFCPSYWIDNLKEEAEFLIAIPVVLSYQYMLFFVYCNAFFKGKPSVSQVSAPWGELAEIKEKRGMAIATLNPQKLKRFRRHLSGAFWGRKL